VFGAATRHRLGNEVGTVSNSQIVSYEKERKEDYFRWRRDLSIDTGRPYKCYGVIMDDLKLIKIFATVQVVLSILIFIVVVCTMILSK
jgi:hypothetical protein